MLLPGVGAGDPRGVVDVGVAPWASVARMQIAGVSRCTAVLIAPHWAATALHCMGERRLGHVAPAGAVHLLFGYRDGAVARHVVPDRVVVPEGAESDGAWGSDLVLLHLGEALGGALAPDGRAVAPGTGLALAGYDRDRAERLTADQGCRAWGYGKDKAGRPVLRHDCAGTQGGSGGPVLARDGAGGWGLVGIETAASLKGAGGLAVPGFTLAAWLAAAE